MKNGYKLVWTNKALSDLDAIILYLETNWSEKELRKFFCKLETRINLIAQRPQLYSLSQSRKNLRRSVLIPQVTIYYRIIKDAVEVLRLFDNRQNPENLKLK